MAGRGDTSRLTQVRAWTAERAACLGVPMSVGLLCDTAVARLDVSGATLTVDTSRGWSETRYSTDPLGGALAELHLTVGEGPCAEARLTGGPVLVPDLDAPASQRRWPLFAPLAVEAGVAAVFALPLCVGAIRVGVLTLHRVAAGRLDPTTLRDSLAFATMSLRLLLDEQAGLLAVDGDAVEGLPLHDPRLHQATGMISAQLDIGMEDAFARLRARAFSDQRPLTDLAADVVARRLRFDPTKEST